MCDYRTELFSTLRKTHALALESIHNAQEKQRKFYNQQSTNSKLQIGDRAMVFMPNETTSKDGKLVRPYHGPYHVVSLTQMSAEVRLIDYLSEPTIFVSIERLRRCYPEQTNDSCLGKKRTPRKKMKQLAVSPQAPRKVLSPGQ